MSENTASRDDWELSRGQYDYLHDERLYRKVFDGDDHVHCELCWQTIEPTDHDPSYCTTDERLWICEKCFLKYRKLLGWYVAPEEGEQMYIGTDIPKTCELLPKLKEAPTALIGNISGRLDTKTTKMPCFSAQMIWRGKKRPKHILRFMSQRGSSRSNGSHAMRQKSPAFWMFCPITLPVRFRH